MARSRARARSGHGRLGAALRVVAALLRTGEPVPPLVRGVPRSVRAASAAPASAPPGPQIGARTRDFSPAHTCVPLAGGLPRGIYARGQCSRVLAVLQIPGETTQPQLPWSVTQFSSFSQLGKLRPRKRGTRFAHWLLRLRGTFAIGRRG